MSFFNKHSLVFVWITGWWSQALWILQVRKLTNVLKPTTRSCLPVTIHRGSHGWTSWAAIKLDQPNSCNMTCWKCWSKIQWQLSPVAGWNNIIDWTIDGNIFRSQHFGLEMALGTVWITCNQHQEKQNAPEAFLSLWWTVCLSSLSTSTKHDLTQAGKNHPKEAWCLATTTDHPSEILSLLVMKLMVLWLLS